MEQTDFKDWKGYVGDKYRLAKKDNADMPFKLKDAHWMNFGWGTERAPITGEEKMVHHPNRVWFRNSHSSEEPWKRVKVVRKPTPLTSPAKLYNSPVALSAEKLKDLQKITEKHLPEPQRSFYFNLLAAADVESDCDSDS